MGYDRRLKALEVALVSGSSAKQYDMSMLTDEQLSLIERMAPREVKVGGHYRLALETLDRREIGELEKALWLTGVLRNGERLK